jgi:hypothetical protein
VIQVFNETIKERPKEGRIEIRFLKHLISYTEYQFGDRVPGKAYCERGNTRIDNWKVEIDILICLYNDLNSAYQKNTTLGMINYHNLIFPYFEKELDLLVPWLTDSLLKKDQTNHVLESLSILEGNIARVQINRNEFNLAESYCQQALSHARQYEGTEEKKTELECNALYVFYGILGKQGKYADALLNAEEAYNISAITYNPVHPKVQEAASKLIEVLVHMVDLEKAETFAQLTLDSLKDTKNGLDQQSEAVAKGYYDLGNVLFKQKRNFVKAEMLVRESLRIRVFLFNDDDFSVGSTTGLLGGILVAQLKIGKDYIIF